MTAAAGVLHEGSAVHFLHQVLGKLMAVCNTGEQRSQTASEVLLVSCCRSGEVEPRPGVLNLMDEARAAGLKVAVCSAATKSSVVFTLKNLLGEQRFSQLDCFLAGELGRALNALFRLQNKLHCI